MEAALEAALARVQATTKADLLEAKGSVLETCDYGAPRRGDSQSLQFQFNSFSSLAISGSKTPLR